MARHKPDTTSATVAHTRELANIDTKIAQHWATYRNWHKGANHGLVTPIDALEAIDHLLETRHGLTTSHGEAMNPLDRASASEWGPADTGTAA